MKTHDAGVFRPLHPPITCIILKIIYIKAEVRTQRKDDSFYKDQAVKDVQASVT
jgi:hypothetical protein